MTENIGKVIVFGWLPDGRPIRFEQPSHGDTIAHDIEFAQRIAAAMTQAGISPRPIEADMEEKSEIVHYVLRTETENEYGISQKVYLYTERFTFKFLHIYLNNEQMIADFERAFGFSPLQLPHYEGEVALERGKNPKKDSQYIVKLRNPVQVFYKRNPRWSEDLSEEDRKKIQKNIFVRWGSTSGDTTDVPAATDGERGQTMQPQRRLPVESPERSRMDNEWNITFQHLMQHSDIVRAYPQQNHRANAINGLRKSNVLTGDLNSMAYRVCAYQAYRNAGKTQDEAIADVLSIEDLNF